MAELTIQISDELAQRLKPLQHQLPELLGQLVEAAPHPSSSGLEVKADSSALPAVYQEVLDFLIKRPTASEIAAFKVSESAQERLQELLEKNRSGTITPAELAELDVCEQLNHLTILLKARASAAIN